MLKPEMIGNKIADARKKTNISQAQLANQLFISPQAVGKWERGESLPDILTLTRLAEILGVDLNYFSESFPSASPEAAPLVEAKPTMVSPPAKFKKRQRWDMSNENLVDADFSGLNNLHEKFGNSNLQNCLFVGSNLAGLVLKNNNVDRCDFSHSDISQSQIQHSNLGQNQFRDCLLREAEFSENNISGCDFTGADFTGATLRANNFEKNILKNAVWSRTSFLMTQLDEVVFEGTLEDCSFEQCGFSKVTFQNATLTNTFFKHIRRLRRVQFVDCKMDKLTYAFLKNGRADLSKVTLLPA
jgi:uncharacterized protein YjbI with pentapeptide repeats